MLKRCAQKHQHHRFRSWLIEHNEHLGEPSPKNSILICPIKMLSHQKSTMNCSAGVDRSSWGSTDRRHSCVIFLCIPTVGYSGHVCSEQNFSPVSPLCCPRTLWQRASCCLISRPVTTAHGGVHNQQWERSQCSSFVRPLSLLHWFPTHIGGQGAT